MMFLFDVLGNVEIAIRILCAYICQFIYSAIAGLFNVFMKIASFSFVDENGQYFLNVYNRITVILELIMIFYVTFEFIKYIVQPETITDKEKGVSKIGVKVVVVVLAIAFVPKIFTYAYKLQSVIIDGEVLSKVILGKKMSEDTDTTPGGTFSTLMLRQFYFYDEDLYGDEECEDKIKCKIIYNTNMATLSSSGKLYSLPLGLKAAKKDTDNALTPLIEFDAIAATIVGAVIAYMLVIYSVDVGARIFQMIFLQVIAPIPIIGYLSPKKDNMFTKWAKQCAVTYVDIFIRLALMYFIILATQALSNILGDVFEEGWGIDWGDKIIFVALVLGLFVFVNRASKMISELLPKSSTAASGNFGLKAGDRNIGRAIGAALGLTAGTVAGAATGIAQGLRAAKAVDGKGRKALAGTLGGAWGAVRGTVGGAARGLWAGGSKSSNESLGKFGKNTLKGSSGISSSNKKFGNRLAAGYTIDKRIGDKLGETFGGGNRKQRLENSKAPLKRQKDALSEEKKSIKAIQEEADKQVRAGKGRLSGQLLDAEARLKDLQENPRAKERFKRRSEKTEELRAEKKAAVNSQMNEEIKKSATEKIAKQGYRLSGEAEYRKAREKAAAGIKEENYKETDQEKFEAAKKAAEAAAYKKVSISDFRMVDKDGNVTYDKAAFEKALKTEKEKAVAGVKEEDYQVTNKEKFEAARQAEMDKVKREDYAPADGFDKKGYEAAQAAAAAAAVSSISVPEYMDNVGEGKKYKTIAEATAAYKQKCEEVAETARKSIDKDDYQLSYSSTEEAEEAYKRKCDKAAQAARENVDTEKFAYITKGDDGIERKEYRGKELAAEYARVEQEAREAVDRSRFVVACDSDEEIEATKQRDMEKYVAEERVRRGEEYARRVEAELATVPDEFEIDEDAYSQALQEAAQRVDEVTKEARNDFITNGDINGEQNATIEALRETAATMREQYNLYAGKDYTIPEKITVVRDGAQVEVDIKDLNGKELDDYLKGKIPGVAGIKQQEDNLERKTIEIDAEIASIDRQTAGSSDKH